MSIEPLSIQDEVVAGQIVCLHRIAYRQEATLLGLSSLPGMERSTTNIRALKETFFGTYAEGELVGAISAAEESPGCLTICSLTVLPAFQRRGLGRALLCHILRLKPKRGNTYISTAAENFRAIALYQQEGFAVYGETLVPDQALKLVHLCRKRTEFSDAS
jgi:ribosomal protein S18 acetylase RimI-like enzyme